MGRALISILFDGIEDPRVERTRRHKLTDVLLVALIGVLVGERGWDGIADYAEAHEHELRRLLEFPHGTPSADTIRRVLSAVDVGALNRALTMWTQALCVSMEGKQIAVDGKTIRKSFDDSGQSALHMIHAWVCENELLLGQRSTDVKSNEITAIPELLKLLDLRKSVVTIDAMGCQKEIAKTIVEKGADYVFGLKGNQPTLHDEVIRAFDEDALVRARSCSESYDESADKGHGRLENRRVYCLRDVSWLTQSEQWPRLQTLVLVEAESWRHGERSFERRAYISSLDAPASRFSSLVRNHWHVENKLHWVLDVTFGEDRARIKAKNGAQALSTLRKIAMGLARRAPEGKRKTSLVGKMRRASWSFETLLRTLCSGLPDDASASVGSRAKSRS